MPHRRLAQGKLLKVHKGMRKALPLEEQVTRPARNARPWHRGRKRKGREALAKCPSSGNQHPNLMKTQNGAVWNHRAYEVPGEINSIKPPLDKQ